MSLQLPPMHLWANQPILMLLILLTVQVSPFLSNLNAMPQPPMQADVPVEETIHFPILLNVLTFDRNLKQRVGNEIVLAILYQEKNRQSLNARISIEQYLQQSSTRQLEGIPLRIIPIDFSNIEQLRDALVTEKVNLLYLTPLRAVNVAAIADLSQSLKITSLTGVPAYCELGVTVAIGTKGGGPQVVVNLPCALAIGCDFSSKLLKLTRVIQSPQKGR